MSKLLKIILSITLALTTCLAFVGCDDTDDDGSAVNTGEFLYELVENDKDGEADYYKIVGYTVSSDDALKMAQGDFESVKDKRDIKIPDKYKGLDVKEIGSMAFADQIILKSVDFEGSNVETIGVGAFSGCTSLEEIKNLPFIGKSESAVGQDRVLGHLFGSSSTSQKNVEVKAKSKYEIEEADLTFNVPASLKSVSTKSTVIPECAFYGFSMLETVVMQNATEIGKSAFNGCSGIIAVDVSSAIYLYDGAFEGCIALQQVTFGNELTYVGDGAFLGCSRLGYNFVSDEREDLTVTLPNSVEYLGANAFSGCSTLKYVVLGDKIAELKTGAFKGCVELKEVKTLSSNVIFRAGVFSGCEKENVIVYKNDGVTEWELSNEVFGEATTD